MEKSAAPIKAKNKFLKLIPKAAQAVATSLQNMPFSPRRDARPEALRLKTKGFSGPLGPMIPAEARRKSRNFDAQEPTSPKVSCIGQVKYKNKNKVPKHKKRVSPPKELMKHASDSPRTGKTKKTRKPSGFFGRKAGSGSGPVQGAGPVETTPSLSQMRKFASSREAFANFDWTAAQIAPEEDRGFYSDGERGYSDDEDDVSIPFSAPILIAGGGCLDLEPRKEINLWKRRTMTPPAPLNIDGEN